MARGKRTVRASEIGSFVFCQRAWLYQRRDKEPLNKDELAAGSSFHNLHARQARSVGLVQLIAWFLIFSALVFLSVYFSIRFFG